MGYGHSLHLRLVSRICRQVLHSLKCVVAEPITSVGTVCWNQISPFLHPLMRLHLTDRLTFHSFIKTLMGYGHSLRLRLASRICRQVLHCLKCVGQGRLRSNLLILQIYTFFLLLRGMPSIDGPTTHWDLTTSQKHLRAT